MDTGRLRNVVLIRRKRMIKPLKISSLGFCRALFIFLSIMFLYNADSQAVSTHFFTQSSSAEFDQGKKNLVSLVNDGITLSPNLNLIKGMEEPYVWCLTTDKYDNVYIGTGDPGSVYKLSPTGDLTLLHKFQELYVQSLAVSSTGYIFVGTSPQGVIYKITPWREVIMVCDLPDSYVWRLKFDGADRLYAATGPEGRIYRISENGEVTVFYDSPQSHVLDMTIDKENNLYACSEPDGLIYKLTPDGKAFVIYDAEEGEIHCLSIDSAGDLYAGTASGAHPQLPVTPPAPPTIPPLEPLLSTETIQLKETDPLQQEFQPVPRPPSGPALKPPYQPPPYTGAMKVTNVVYKIMPDGIIKKVLVVKDGLILALYTDEDNNTYAGTGNKAELYKIDKDENVITLLETEESQVLSLTSTRQRGLFFGTGNEGNLYELSRTYAEKGNFESSVLDANIHSSWGNISWDADVPEGTAITIATRTGNSEKPDNTWSEWSAGRASGEKIESPTARFVQYRATLSAALSNAIPLLKSVSLAYLPQNQPPEITSLTVDQEHALKPGKKVQYGDRHMPPKQADIRGTAGENVSGKPPEARKTPSPGTKSIQWQAADPNGDNMSFTLYYKGVKERTWKFLQKETEKSSYLWQTTRVPDGEYLVKLVATDSPDNPPEVALSTEEITQAFIVDNTRPKITNLTVSASRHKRASVEGLVADELSNISKLQYSVDAGDWIGIFPEDKIFDAREESFRFTVEGLAPGEHTIVINTADEEGNIGSGKVLVEISD